MSIDGLELTSAPETSQTIRLTSSDLLDTNAITLLEVTVRACEPGEQLTGSGA